MIIKAKLNEFTSTRIKKGFSQRGLGRAANLSGALINQIESNDRNPSPESAKKICDVLQVNFDDIFFTESVCKSEQEKQII
ncbi:helix-turn-helix transcriptional regulator [Oceanobacillus sp. FSL W7-1281]|uniref:helix-turn-helix transcriptional regulator n=1 Tax=Oceanobacillus sp. FSL W7-1281 TaxID=2921698 RepID=UPI0030DD3C02